MTIIQRQELSQIYPPSHQKYKQDRDYQHLLTTTLYYKCQLPSITSDNALKSGFSEAFTHIPIWVLKKKARLKPVVNPKPPLTLTSSASGGDPWEAG